MLQGLMFPGSYVLRILFPWGKVLKVLSLQEHWTLKKDAGSILPQGPMFATSVHTHEAWLCLGQITLELGKMGLFVVLPLSAIQILGT